MRLGHLRAASLLLAVVLGSGAAGAAEEYALRLSNELMSPYCPGRTLSDCPSGEAAQLRAWIAEQERQGRTRQDVEAQLLRVYGEEILGAPRARGFGLAAYVLPVALMGAGAAVLYVFLRRQGRDRAEALPAAPEAVDSELERQVDEELRRV
jgi:cytochrome c-type biogenesis protein CcmH